jgi:flavin reductase (DIM6/NTAB) family NADH-FMN oxidoreductase RutF
MTSGRQTSPVGAAAFRSVMRRFPTGVAIVTTVLEGRPKGFTATAIASVSLEPPLVLVCANRHGRSHPIVAAAEHFCVNLLTQAQEPLAHAFAHPSDEDPFANVAYRAGSTGSPVLAGALAYLDCTLAEEYVAGTHAIFVGCVVECGGTAGEPLGYFGGGYANFGVRVE